MFHISVKSICHAGSFNALRKTRTIRLWRTVLRMSKSYLSETWQHININGTCTDHRPILTRAPQVPKPGPFLFLLYMNDLDANSGDSKGTIFAGDMTLLNARNMKIFSKHGVVESVLNWQAKYSLIVNLDNCQLMCFGSGKSTGFESMEYSSEKQKLL